ncbi:MAG: catalase/peroxidase HPI [Pseudomonadota bacterium]
MKRSTGLNLVGVSVLALAIAACGQQTSSVTAAGSAQAQTPEATAAGTVSAKADYAPAADEKGKRTAARTNREWWPEQLDLTELRQNAGDHDPSTEYDYAAAFNALDLEAVKTDIKTAMRTSQDWWPADYGHYGPFFIRMAWHSAGTYRISDGRGGAGAGQQRFEPLNSWPDNTNLDKAQRLLWPIKQKYGRSISWADLMVLTGTVAMEDMGFKTFGFAGGREDAWTPDLVYWGPENKFLADQRYSGDRKLQKSLAAVQMGLIYVNPEGPNGTPDPVAAAQDIRETFGRMAMNDEETVALIAGGHTFGKAHGAKSPAECVGPEPAGATLEEQGLGWKNKCGTGKGADTITSGLEGSWTANPAQWTHEYLTNLFSYEWKQTRSPAGAVQWIPTDEGASALTPDAHDPDKRHAPIMFTTDLSLKFDPAYREISERFLEDPAAFEDAFARAWFKLTHRDMGPKARYLGADVPADDLIWQDPIPAIDHALINNRDVKTLKAAILETDASVSDLVRAAWASASTYRDTDKRGGANGARVRLAPQRDWAVNDPEALATVLTALEGVQTNFNDRQRGDKRVSMADLIVLGGAAAIEKAAADAGFDVTVPFTPGRGDATDAHTDAASFAVLEPKSDGFRNYLGSADSSPAAALIDRADLLNLSVSEMTVLVGGMRALGANAGGAKHGVLTDNPGTLSNDFFVNLLGMETRWQPAKDAAFMYEGYDRESGDMKWTATEVDLMFGSNSELRAVAEAYAYTDAGEAFVDDFVAAWSRVMRNDRFDL